MVKPLLGPGKRPADRLWTWLYTWLNNSPSLSLFPLPRNKAADINISASSGRIHGSKSPFPLRGSSSYGDYRTSAWESLPSSPTTLCFRRELQTEPMQPKSALSKLVAGTITLSGCASCKAGMICPGRRAVTLTIGLKSAV